MRISFLVLFVIAGTSFAQISPPQINLTGNIGCQGFPCVNSGTLIMASDANRTMTAQETSAANIKVTSSVALTATRNLIAPAGLFHFTIENATTGGQSIQIIGPSGSGVTIPNGATVSVWNDGTNYVTGIVATTSNPGTSSQVSTFPGTVAAGAAILASQYVPSVNPVNDSPSLNLSSFSGSATPVLTHDSNSWDSNGIGSPGRLIYVNGLYWMPVAGYSTSSYSSAQKFGWAYAATPAGPFTMWSGNPFYTNGLGVTCVEGPRTVQDTSGNLYVYFDSYTGTCDAKVGGNVEIYVIHSTVARFTANPGDWDTPILISTLPGSLQWMFSFNATYYNGMWYAVQNAGDSGGNPVIVMWSSASPTSGWTLYGTVVATGVCGSGIELQEPNLDISPTGKFFRILFDCGDNARIMLATSTSILSTYTAWSGNPVSSTGAGTYYLPSLSADSNGDYWLYTNMNNVTAVYVSKGQSPLAVTPSIPLASSLGLTVDGSDQSANFMTLANTYQIAGVPLAFVVDANGSCLNLSTIGTLPNDGNATHPRQIPIHISGAAYQVDGTYANPTVTGSCLEVGSTGVAGIDTRGFGQLELDHLIIKQAGSGSAPIIQTTNTNLRPHDVYLWGTGCQWNARNAGIMLGSSDINNTTSPGLGATGAYWAYGSSGNNIIFHCVNQAIWSRTGANASLWTSLVVDAQSGDNTTLAQVQGAQASATAYSYSSNLLTLTATNSYAAGTYVQLRNSSGDALHALNGKIYQISATGLSGSQIEIPTAAITGSGSTTTTLIGVTTIPVANTTYSASAGTLTLTGTNIYATGNTITFQPPPYVHNTTWTSTGSSVTINATNSYTTSSAITFQDSPGDPLYALACTSGAIGSSTCPSFTPTATSGTSYTIPTSLIAAGSGSTISTAYSDPLVPLFCWGGYVGSSTCPSFTVQAGPTNSSYNILTTLVTGSGSTSATSQDVGYKAPFSFTGWTPGGTQIGPGYVETTYYADAGVLLSGSSPNNTFPGMAYYDPKATCGLGGCLSGGNYYPGTLNYIHIAQAASGGYTNDNTFSGQYFGGAAAVSLIQNDISTSESYNIQAGQSIYGDLTFLGYNMNHTPLHVPPNADASTTTGDFWNRSGVDPVNPGCNYGVMRYSGRFGVQACSTTTPYIFVTNALNGGGTTYYYDALIQTTLGGLSVTAPSATQSTNYFTFNYGTLKVPYSKSASGYNCLQIDSSGIITNTGAACASSGGASVTSLNTLTGSVNVTAGAGVNVAVSGQNIQVSAPGNGADLGSGLLERSMIESSGSPYFCCGTGGYTHEGTTAAIANATSSMPAMLNSTSTAGLNDLAGWAAANQGIYYTSQTPNVLIPIGFPSSADYGSTNSERILIGVAYLAGGGCSAATLMASDAPTCDFAAVRYSNVASDTTFVCVVDDAGSVTTAAITGAVPTASHPIYVQVTPTGSSTVCTVTINGTAYSATVTATLPNTALGAFFMNQAETSTAVHIMAQGVLGTN